MAAADLSSSRGAAGGLLTLLCVLCLATSLDYNKLREIETSNQKIQQQLEHLKAQKSSILDFFHGYVSDFEPMLEILKEESKESPEALEKLEDMESSMEKAKTFVAWQTERMDEEIANTELHLEYMRKAIQAAEGRKDEL